MNEADDAYREGLLSGKYLDNPYWLEYPKPAKGGPKEELKARRYVDGCAARNGS